MGTGPADLEVSRPIPTTTPGQTLAAVVEFFRGRRLRSLGLASFGPLDPARGVIARNTPKAAWRGCHLQDRLAQALGVRVHTDTDVNGAALAEGRWGVAVGRDPFLYITVGTGIGVGGFVNGGLLHGQLHPEAGHLLLPRAVGDRFAGICPIHGDCLEGLACGPAMAARIQSGQGEAAAVAFAVDALAKGLLNLSYTLSPHLVILGGGVMKRPGLLASVRRQMVLQNRKYVVLPKLVRPKLGDRAGVLGALALAGA